MSPHCTIQISLMLIMSITTELPFFLSQREELNAQNTDRMLLISREFLEGVKSLHLTLEAEAAEGNVNCLKKNRSENFALDWMERNVVNRILMRKLLAEVLIGVRVTLMVLSRFNAS